MCSTVGWLPLMALSANNNTLSTLSYWHGQFLERKDLAVGWGHSGSKWQCKVQFLNRFKKTVDLYQNTFIKAKCQFCYILLENYTCLE